MCACDPRDEVGRAKALERSVAMLAMIEGEPKGFAALAARDSDCGSKSSGGALGQLGPGDTVPEFEAALRALSEGEITAEPVITRHGYHIIRMDAVALGQVLPFDAVKSKIAIAIAIAIEKNHMGAKCQAIRRTIWLRQRRSKGQISGQRDRLAINTVRRRNLRDDWEY